MFNGMIAGNLQFSMDLTCDDLCYWLELNEISGDDLKVFKGINKSASYQVIVVYMYVTVSCKINGDMYIKWCMESLIYNHDTMHICLLYIQIKALMERPSLLYPLIGKVSREILVVL